jgi:anti-sigma-K factor RskA
MSDERSMHEKFSGDAAAYALGALEPAEAEAFRRHLESCAICRDELSALTTATDVLPRAVPQYRPPSGLRRRVFEQIRAEAPVAPAADRGGAFGAVRRSPRRAALAGVLLAAAAIAVAGILRGGSSGTRVFTATVGHARLYVSSGRGELVVRRLAVPPPGEVYEVWRLAAHRAPRPSGLFVVTPAGSARVTVAGSLHGVSAVAVSREPAGGTSRPTTTPVIVVTIS